MGLERLIIIKKGFNLAGYLLQGQRLRFSGRVSEICLDVGQQIPLAQKQY